MKAQICWTVSEDAWQAFFDATPDASPFHSPAWYSAWRAETGQPVAAAGFKFGDGARALLPLAFDRSAGRTVQSGVAGGYGGLFGPSSLSPRHVRLAFKALARKYPDVAVRSFPHQRWPGVPHDLPAAADRTFRVRLGTREAMRKAYSKNRRRDARFALEYGVDFGPLGGARLEAFLALEHEAAGRNARGDEFWRTLSSLLPDLGLCLACQQGQLAAGCVFAWRAGIAYDLALLVSPRFRNGEAATAVTEGALVYAFTLGQDVFDFMPSGLEGVRRFHESFGANPLPVHAFRHRGALGRALGLLRLQA